jgi:hypothetical protein
MNIEKEHALVVTTEWRGVFFGYGIPTKERHIVLRDCRMCVYWDKSVKGMPGLTSGSLAGCRISPPAPSVLLHKVTGVWTVTGETEKEWLKTHWS